MNRRNFFKGIAALPLAVVAPKALPAPEPAKLSRELVWPTDFVPRNGMLYVLHRGEPRTVINTFVLPPGGTSAETQKQIEEGRKRRELH